MSLLISFYISIFFFYILLIFIAFYIFQSLNFQRLQNFCISKIFKSFKSQNIEILILKSQNLNFKLQRYKLTNFNINCSFLYDHFIISLIIFNLLYKKLKIKILYQMKEDQFSLLAHIKKQINQKVFLDFIKNLQRVQQHCKSIQTSQFVKKIQSNSMLGKNQYNKIGQKKKEQSRSSDQFEDQNSDQEQRDSSEFRQKQSLKSNNQKFDDVSQRIQSFQNAGNVRKSSRLHEKKIRMQNNSQNYLEKFKKNTSLIKKIERQRKAQQNKQFLRSMIERIKNPGNATLRLAKIMFIDDMIHYSIDVKYKQLCKNHSKNQKVQHQRDQDSEVDEINQRQKYRNNECQYCINPGRYWFSSEKLKKYNNGNYIRRYLQSFL